MKWEAEGGKELLLVAIKKVCAKERLLVCEKGLFFQLMQGYPIKKSIFQHTKISISHYTKANEQSQISSAKTSCELAVQ